MRLLIAQLARFGTVGIAGLVFDVAVFNLLRATVFDPDVVNHGSIIAKTISTLVAIAVNYFGNRYWAFRHHRRTDVPREGAEFVLVSVGGMFLTLGCLWFSHSVLGFTSVLADNIAGNVVGLAVGTAFRFGFYRYWVFNPNRARSIASTQTAPSSMSIIETSTIPVIRRVSTGRIGTVPAIDDRARFHD